MEPVLFSPISERSGHFPNCPGGGWNLTKKKKVTACALKLHTGVGEVASICSDEKDVERRGKTEGKKLVAKRLNSNVRAGLLGSREFKGVALRIQKSGGWETNRPVSQSICCVSVHRSLQI